MADPVVRRGALPRLHLLTDTVLQQRFSHLEQVQMAVAAGADAVQVRAKDWVGNVVPDELHAIVAAAKGSRTNIIVNDWVGHAAATGADGVHVGQDDADPRLARSALGPQRWIGLTVHTLAELQRVDASVVDYVGIGPVFGTTSKSLAFPPLGLEGLAQLCNLSPVPVIAIGSVTEANLPAVLAAGAYGVAVLSAFSCHADPYAAACRLQRLVDENAHILP